MARFCGFIKPLITTACISANPESYGMIMTHGRYEQRYSLIPDTVNAKRHDNLRPDSQHIRKFYQDQSNYIHLFVDPTSSKEPYQYHFYITKGEECFHCYSPSILFCETNDPEKRINLKIWDENQDDVLKAMSFMNAEFEALIPDMNISARAGLGILAQGSNNNNKASFHLFISMGLIALFNVIYSFIAVCFCLEQNVTVNRLKEMLRMYQFERKSVNVTNKTEDVAKKCKPLPHKEVNKKQLTAELQLAEETTEFYIDAEESKEEKPIQQTQLQVDNKQESVQSIFNDQETSSDKPDNEKPNTAPIEINVDKHENESEQPQVTQSKPKAELQDIKTKGECFDNSLKNSVEIQKVLEDDILEVMVSDEGFNIMIEKEQLESQECDHKSNLKINLSSI